MNIETKNRINNAFRANITRVRSLVEAYDALGSAGAGRPSIQQTDVLRAAVVLLHASLEDLIRSSSEELLPEAGAEVLETIGIPDGAEKTKTKFSLGDLHPHKGITVDELIRKGVQASLQRSNYNSVTELSSALKRIGLCPTLLNPYQGHILAIMKRRHLIVHRADKTPQLSRGPGLPTTTHLAKDDVVKWIGIIEIVGNQIAAALPVA